MTGTSLRTYLLTRLALVVPMVFILLTLVFLLMRVAPGNPIAAALGGHVPAAQVKLIEHREYIARYGDDIPEISGWRWGQEASAKAGSSTEADNV